MRGAGPVPPPCRTAAAADGRRAVLRSKPCTTGISIHADPPGVWPAPTLLTARLQYVGPIRYARNLDAIAELWIHLSIPGCGEGAEDWGRDFHFQVVDKE